MRVLKILLGLFASTCLFVFIAVVWEAECRAPSDDLKRGFVMAVAEIEEAELRSTGTVGDLEAQIRSAYPGAPALNDYRVVTRRVKNGYDVLIEPRSWCLCRRTYAIHDGGRKLVVIVPILGR